MSALPELDVDHFMEQVYPSPPCWCAVSQIYIEVLGETVDEYKTIATSIRQLATSLRLQAIAAAFRLELYKGAHGFSQIAEPVDYAVVLMGRTRKLGMHHSGIFYGGKVFHALDSGNLYQDMDTLRAEYQLMEFWSRA